MIKQAAYRLRHRAAGLCLLCPRPAHKAGRCEAHYRDHLKGKRKGKGPAPERRRHLLGLHAQATELANRLMEERR